MIILEIPGEEFFVESSKNLKEAEKFLDKYKNQKGLRILMSVSHGQGVRFVPVTSILKSRTAEQICLAADNIEIFKKATEKESAWLFPQSVFDDFQKNLEQEALLKEYMLIFELPNDQIMFMSNESVVSSLSDFIKRNKNILGEDRYNQLLRVSILTEDSEGYLNKPLFVTSFIVGRTPEEVSYIMEHIVDFYNICRGDQMGVSPDEPFDSLVYKNGPVNKEDPTQLIPVM